MIRRVISLAALLLVAASAPAAADYVIKDGNGVTKTVTAFDCTSKICAAYVPIDMTGAAFGVSGNPFYVILSGASTVQATQSGTWTIQPGNTPNSAPWLFTLSQGGNAATISAGGALKVDASASTQPVSGTVAATQSGTWTVTSAATTGGLSTYFVQPAASDNHANVKNGAGQVYKVSVTNNSTTVNYLRLYDAGTGFNGCNSATNLKYQIAIPAASASNSTGIIDSWNNGMTFTTGISICISGGYSTTDTTSATASAMSVTIGYK